MTRHVSGSRPSVFRWLLLGVLFFPNRAAADSDGYYCVGPDYLAYEFSFSDSIPGHNLFIVHFSDAVTEIIPLRLPLPDFQVHGMMCEDTTVHILGWSELYRVDVNRGGQPRVRETVTLDPPGSTVEGFERQSRNLGSLRLEATQHVLHRGRLRYELQFETDPPSLDEDTGSTILIVRNAASQIVTSRRLYQGWIRTN